MAALSFTVPTGKDPGFKVGSLPIQGLFSYSAPGVGNPFNVEEDGAIFIEDSNYESLTYPYVWTVQVLPRGGGASLGSHTITFQKATLEPRTSTLIFVDPINGNNLNEGRIDSPISSISLAMEQILGGGVLLLATGAYGDTALTKKPITIKGLKGESTRFLGLSSVVSSSYIFENLYFQGGGVQLSTGGEAAGGSVTVRNCFFSSDVYPAGISSLNFRYVSLLQNRLQGSGPIFLDVRAAEESTVVSNIMGGENEGYVNFENVKQVSFLHNTIDNVPSVNFDDVGSVASYGVTYLLITTALLASKSVVFPAPFRVDAFGTPAVAVNMVSGAAQEYLVDWTATGSTLSWAGLGMDSDLYSVADGGLEEGDILRINYELIGGSGESGVYFVDSNNITNVASVTFTSGLFATVAYNNFFGSVITLSLTNTNIVLDPLYIGAPTKDYSLDDLSPSRHSANPALGYSLNALNKVSLYQQLQDNTKTPRVYKKTITDMGALENLAEVVRSEGTLHLADDGHDAVNSGDSLEPVRHLSFAMGEASNDPIKTIMGAVTPMVSIRKRYSDESTIPLKDTVTSVADVRTPVTGVSLPDLAVIQPFDSFMPSGSRVYISMDGDDLTGNGTEGRPYKTIDKALTTSATIICVIAGAYPWFTGEPGKTLVFLPRNFQEYLGSFRTTSFSGESWTILESSGSTYSLSAASAVISHP